MIRRESVWVALGEYGDVEGPVMMVVQVEGMSLNGMLMATDPKDVELVVGAAKLASEREGRPIRVVRFDSPTEIASFGKD